MVRRVLFKRSRSDRAVARKRIRGPARSESENLLLECQSKKYELTNEATHALEILEEYTKRHVVSVEPVVLREILRTTHRVLPPGPPKSKIRGILVFLTRTNIMVTWMKISRALKVLGELHRVNTFSKPKEIPFDRIVDSTTLLQMSSNPRYEERIEIADAKIQRMRTGGRPLGPGRAQTPAPANEH